MRPDPSRLAPSKSPVVARLVKRLAPLALIAAAILPTAACSDDTDPYCADGDMSDWITTLSASAVWIKDGQARLLIQVNFDTNNGAFIFLPDDAFFPEDSRVLYSLPVFGIGAHGEQVMRGRKVILLPDTGVSTAGLSSYVLCQGIRGDYKFAFTWAGTPKEGDPIDVKLQVNK